MDRQKDDGGVTKNDQSTSSTTIQEEGSTSCTPVSPPSVAVPKKKEVNKGEKEEQPITASLSSSNNTKTVTKTTVCGDSNVVEKAAGVRDYSQEEKPPVSVYEEKTNITRGVSPTTNLQLNKITTKDDNDGKTPKKLEISTTIIITPSTTKNTNTAMSDQSITTTTTCSQDGDTSITNDTTSTSKTVNNDGFDSSKVLEKPININSSSQQPNQQVKSKDISNDTDDESEHKNNTNLVVGSTSVVSTTLPTVSNTKPNVKMTSVVSDSKKTGDESTQQKQHGRIMPPIIQQNSNKTQVICNEEKNAPSFSSDGCSVIDVGKEIQSYDKSEKIDTSSVMAKNIDTTGGRKKEGTQPGETTCLDQQPPPKRIVSDHHSKDEGNISRNNNDDDDNQQVTSDDKSLNQFVSQKNAESSPVKPSDSVSISASNPVQKSDSPTQKNANIKLLPKEPSENTEPTLQSTLVLLPPESKPDQTGLVSANMKPSTNSSLESASSRLPSLDSVPPQADESGTVSSSPLKQPLGEADDGSGSITAVSTAPTQTVQSSTDDSSKRFPSTNLGGASQSAEPTSSSSSSSSSSNFKPSTKQCAQGQDVITDHSMLSKGSPELTSLSSTRSEVPKISEQDASVAPTTTLSLGDNINKDTDEHSSKRSDSDSQDVTPSDSLSIPSDRDLECVDIASLGAADNDVSATSLKVTKDGASSSSSSSVLSIYHLKWIHFKSKKVPVITQNENGPCPLLAIMNVLLLQGRVTLESGLELITSEQLMDHLDECILENVPKTASEDVQLNYQQNMQDGMAVIHKLQTGLDVNVRFTGVQDFEYTTECILFDLLGISLYHGWLVDPQSHDVVSAIGMCSYNQLVEKIIVQKTSDDIRLLTEATIAENFLEKTASQLTYHGLCELSTTVKEGELCVFFRNNHFSTLYRHKNELFLLVTDQGFLNECNVVWETLSSVEGDCYFVDVDFNTYTKPDPVSGNSVVTPPIVPIGSDQQIDQDYLVALSLEREQQLQREVWAHAGGPGIGGVGLGGGAAVPDSLRGHQGQLSDLELAKKLQDEENQKAGAAAAATATTTSASNRRNPRAAADPCTSSGTRRARDREKDKDGCFIL